MKLALCFLSSYLLGSIPVGWMMSRVVKGIDIREHGSGNIGATNVFRVVGKKWGLLVLVLDVLKGYLAIQVARISFQGALPVVWLLALGLTAIFGHSFPIWLSFKGGKGVATSLGVFLGVFFLPTFLTFLFWCLVFALFRVISIASLSSAVLFPGIVYFFLRNSPDVLFYFCVAVFFVSFYLLYSSQQHSADSSR